MFLLSAFVLGSLSFDKTDLLFYGCVPFCLVLRAEACLLHCMVSFSKALVQQLLDMESKYIWLCAYIVMEWNIQH